MAKILELSVKQGALVTVRFASQATNSFGLGRDSVRISFSLAGGRNGAIYHRRDFSLIPVFSTSSTTSGSAARFTTVPHATLNPESGAPADSIAPVSIYTAAEGKPVQLQDLSGLKNPGRALPVNLVAGVGITAAVLMMAVLGFMAKPGTNGGSVAELIKRGQLRSDRGVSPKNLMYDDPFNNPLVKMGDKNPIVKMCGKLFRLAPVTLTEEKVIKHQNRRIQSYKWRRPMVFLNEGEPVPEGVDPEEVRYIPSNHPFATTSYSIDEESAQKNVYQTRGVPSRVRAEHDALRKKILETTRAEPEFQLPNLENSGAQAWKTLDESPETSGTVSGDDGQRQVNGNGGSNASRNAGVQGGTRSGVSDSRYRTIDFSGEEQGSGRS